MKRLGILFASGMCAVSMQMQASVAQAEEINLPKLMSWTAYTVGTSGYSQAVAIGNMLRTKYDVTVRVLPGRNDISRLAPLVAKRAQLCSCGAGLYLAQEGLNLFADKKWGPVPARMMMMSRAPVGIMMVTQKDRKIKTLKDMRGRRVAYLRGGATQNNIISAYLAAADLTWKDVKRVEFPSYVASINGLINDQVDVIVALTVSPAMRKVAASPDGVHWLPLPHDDTQGWARFLGRAPYFIKTKVRLGAGIKRGTIVDGAMYPYPILISIGGFSAPQAYALTKAMVVNFDAYKTNAPGARGWSIKAQKFTWVLPFHQGAIRYFKEIGKWSSAAQAHNDQLIKRQAVLGAAWKQFKAANGGLGADAYKKGWLATRAKALKEAGMPLHVKY